MYNTPEITAHIKSVVLSESNGDIIIRGYANTTAKDRSGDVIPSATWKSTSALTNYMKNPILLAFHDHKMPIGEVTELNITSEGLEVVARVVKSAPEHVYGLIKDGILKAFSIGFRILDADYNHDTSVFLITDLELLELSVVSVPCNQDSIFSLEKSLCNKDYMELREKFIKPETEEPSELEKLWVMLNSQD
jgi:HK97 family phage prohead protease